MGTAPGPPTRVRSKGLGTPLGGPSVPADGWVAGGWLDAGFPPRPSSPARPRIVSGVMANVAERLVKNRANFAVSVPTWPLHKSCRILRLKTGRRFDEHPWAIAHVCQPVRPRCFPRSK